MERHEFLTPKEAGQYLGGSEPIATSTLARWRYTGSGPRFAKVGGLIRYKVSDLQAWLEARMAADTTKVG